MKKIFLLLVAASGALSGFAQTVNYDSTYPLYTEQLDYIFEHVDLTQVPNRVLKEYGIPLVDPKAFGTLIDSTNYADADLFGLLYATIYSMAIDDAYRLPNPTTYMDRIRAQTEEAPIELLGLFQTYYSIDEGAVENGFFTKENGQLFDVEDRTGDPYLENNTFLMATTRQWLHTDVLQLSYNPVTFFNNTGLSITAFYVDFDDGKGYQDCSGFTIPKITYSTAGFKHLKFKIVDSNGTEWVSHTVVKMDFETEKSTVVIPYDQVDLSFYVTAPEGFGGVTATGHVNISYACGHTSLQKPFIWVEGWNPHSVAEKLNLELGYADAIQRIHSRIDPDNAFTISDYLDQEGYDFVMIDFGSSDIYLESNALMLEEVIRQINGIKHANGSNEKNVVMGQSMGGMCLRYALRDMEVKGQNHECATYVSFDSGHMGVNVPLGAQYAIKHVAQISIGHPSNITISDFVVLLSEAVRILDLPSSREMLYYTTEEYWNGNYWQNDPNINNLHDDYYYRQNEYLGMPEQCENIAIINGSLNGVSGKHNYEPGDEVIGFTGNSFILEPQVSVLYSNNYAWGFTGYGLNVLTSVFQTDISTDLHVHALQDNATDQRIYRGNFLGVVLAMPVIFSVCSKKVSNRQAIDGPEGGYPLQHPVRLNPAMLSATGINYKLNTFCFTPTASTLNDYRNSSNKKRPAYLSSSYADKYAYLNGFPGSGFQAYAGITDPVFDDTLNMFFQNTGHTWFNFQNAPAMRRYLTGVNQIDGISALTSTYNFGKLALGAQLEQLNPGIIRTGSYIRHSFPIDGGVTLSVNSGGYIGYLQNTGSLVTNPFGYFRVDLLKACDDDNPVIVTALPGSTIEIGDAGGRTGDLVINSGTTLDLNPTAKLKINAGSRVVVESGGLLRIGTGAEAIIQNEGTILVRPGGKLIYQQNSLLTTVNENARIIIEGTLALDQNATFKINRSGTNPSGLLIFDGKPKITAETGASFYFDATGNYDPVVQVTANTYVAFDDPDITQVKFSQCGVVMDKHAHMMVARTLLTDHAAFQGRDRIDEKLSFRAKNQFYETTFTDLILQGDMYFPSGDVVNLSNCTFNTLRTSSQGTTPYHVAVYGKGYNIHDCDFSNLTNEASIYSEDLTLTSGVSNCTFTSTIGASAALEDRSNVEIDFYSNTLSNLKEGLIKSTGKLTLGCNTISDMSYRYITATDGAIVNMSTQSGGGYNQFGICTDQNYWSHIWLTASDIDLTKGANTFAYNSYHQYFVRGTIPYSCSSTLTCFRDFTLDNFNYVPSAPQTKFLLKSSNNVTVTCNNAALYFDPACGSLNSGGGTIDPGGDPGSLLSLSSYYSNILEQTVRIDNGVQNATDETTQVADSSGNDLSAMDRFHEIFSSSMPATGDNRAFMLDAQHMMKTAVANLVLDSITDVTQNQAAFTPEIGKYVHSLNKLSDTLIDTANYREQFYMEMKKVHLFRLLGNPSKALEIIANIEACGVDSTEQVVLNREKAYAQRVIAAINYDPETDSVFGFKPAGLIEPISNPKSQYYFGSQIIDPSYVAFMTCLSESDKALSQNGSNEAAGVILDLFPNPATGKINFQLTDESNTNGEVRVFQPDGRTVYKSSAETSGKVQSFDISGWSAGLYQLVYYRSNGTTVQRRFVVQ